MSSRVPCCISVARAQKQRRPGAVFWPRALMSAYLLARCISRPLFPPQVQALPHREPFHWLHIRFTEDRPPPATEITGTGSILQQQADLMPACFPASWGPMVPEEASLPIDVGVPRRPVTIRRPDRNRVVGLLARLRAQAARGRCGGGFQTMTRGAAGSRCPCGVPAPSLTAPAR